ncbi:MAG: hypothetical protein ACKO3L_06795 [Actinomycetota bacterium]|jgi:hypothetical protein
MSTTPRLVPVDPNARSVFGSILAHQPGLAAAFFELYGEFWNRGVLDHASKETSRMRNARITDCGY